MAEFSDHRTNTSADATTEDVLPGNTSAESPSSRAWNAAESPSSRAWNAAESPSSRAWNAASNWQRLDGEYRANYLRILSVVAFYVIHLSDRLFRDSPLQGVLPDPKSYHLAVTLIASCWLLGALMVDVSLRQRRFPSWTAYATTSLDVVLLTATLLVSSGHSSMLVMAFALILILAALRFDLRLIRFTTMIAVAAYLFVGSVAWYGAQTDSIAPAPVDATSQAIAITAIIATGVTLGQMIRRFRNMANEFAARISERHG